MSKVRAASPDSNAPAAGAVMLQVGPLLTSKVVVSERLASSIAELSQHYGTVIFDSPAALPVPDANIVAQHVGACVPIARAGVTRLSAFDSMRAGERRVFRRAVAIDQGCVGQEFERALYVGGRECFATCQDLRQALETVRRLVDQHVEERCRDPRS